MQFSTAIIVIIVVVGVLCLVMINRKPMKAPLNTAKQAQENPIIPILSALQLGASESIYAQEAAGQRDLVESTTLPSEISDEDRKALQKHGVRFGKQVNDDPLFTYAFLPDGWQIKPSDHSMWSYLLDDKGRRRASIFYKAAFYDRKAHLSCERRFSISADYDREDKERVAVAKIMDMDDVIHRTEPVAMIEGKRWQAGEEARNKAQQWLNDRYPEWKDPSAYWGEWDIFPHTIVQ